MRLILLIVSIVLFLVAAFGVESLGGFAATLPLGLAFFAAAFLPIGDIALPSTTRT